MYFPRLCTFQNDGYCCTFSRLNEILLHGGNSEYGGNRHVVFINTPVGENKYIRTLLVGFIALNKKAFHRSFQRGVLIVEQGDCLYMKSRLFDCLDFQQVNACQNRVIYL